MCHFVQKSISVSADFFLKELGLHSISENGLEQIEGISKIF